MGEIIHVDFRDQKIIEGNQPENESATEVKADKKVDSRADHFTRFIQFSSAGNVERLMSLPVSQSSLFQSIEIVKKYETEDLIGWLEKTEENDWRQKPAFFRAIFSELRSRLTQH